ncbi:MAG: hypothetical protein RLZZ226_563 [Pseudomonadota bacterium]|jgi:flagella synthesis protein FlgN
MTVEQAELVRLLARIHAGLADMSGLLAEEASSLQSRDTAAIQSVTARKQALADDINHLTGRQKHLLESMGFSADRPGMECFLSQINDESGQQLWQELIAMTVECKHRNEVNGAYLALLARYVESALDVIMGSPSQGETYDPKGSRRRGSASRRSFTV